MVDAPRRHTHETELMTYSSLACRSASSRLEAAFFDEGVLRQHSARVLSIDRPGYGEATPHKGRNLTTFAGENKESTLTFGGRIATALTYRLGCTGAAAPRLWRGSGWAVMRGAAAVVHSPVQLDHLRLWCAYPAQLLCFERAGDVEQVAMALGLHKLLVVGASVGATYALALAAYLPDRVQATLLLSPSGSTRECRICGLGHHEQQCKSGDLEIDAPQQRPACRRCRLLPFCS